MHQALHKMPAELALDVGLDFARQVAGGDIAAHPWTRTAAHRFEVDLAAASKPDSMWTFDRVRALRPLAFASEMRPLLDVLDLTPWRAWVVAATFGFVARDTGVRRIRQATALTDNPAAHVALVAALALSTTFCEGSKGGEAIASPAVFDVARRMVGAHRGEGLRETFHVQVAEGDEVILQEGTSATLRSIRGDGVGFDLRGADAGDMQITFAEPEGQFFAWT